MELAVAAAATALHDESVAGRFCSLAASHFEAAASAAAAAASADYHCVQNLVEYLGR